MRTGDYPRVCANCRWWEPRDEDEEQCSECGSCHRYPPQAVHMPTYADELPGVFPAVHSTDRCGEHAIMRHPRVSCAAEQAGASAAAPLLAMGT